MDIESIIIKAEFSHLRYTHPELGRLLVLRADGVGTAPTDEEAIAWWEAAPETEERARWTAHWADDEAIARLAREAGEAGDEALRNTCLLLLGDDITLEEVMDGWWSWADDSDDWRIGMMPIWGGKWAIVSTGAGAGFEIDGVAPDRHHAEEQARVAIAATQDER
jgi:hypothetical protein